MEYKVVVFEKREPCLNSLCAGSKHAKSLCQAALTSAVFTLVYCIYTDSIETGRLYWKGFDFLDPLTAKSVIAAIAIDLLFHSAAIAVHPLFNVWHGARAYSKLLVDFIFGFLYFTAVVSSFFITFWSFPFFNLPKYLRVALAVEQIRVCMKSYSFIRENAYKVLYPWHKDDSSGPAVWYKGQMSPVVGSFRQYCYFLFAPTLLYRDHYPRIQAPGINWKAVLMNLFLFIGGLTIAHQIYTKMQISSFYWVDMVHCYLATLPASLVFLCMATTSTMHGWMTMWAELMQFADMRFYEEWWCSETHQEYYRKWNIIPYHFNHQYIYKDIRRAVKKPVFAMFVLILASSLIHEYLIAISFGFFLPILTVLFAGFGVFVVKLRLTGSYVVLLSLYCGFHFMMWSYFTENRARIICPREETTIDMFYPRTIECFMKSNFR